MALNMKGKHLVTIRDLTREEIYQILDTATMLKLRLYAGEYTPILAGKTLGMIFQKPSLRTRVSHEVAMTQLGGHAIYLGPEDIKLGKRETTEDIAIVLSRFVNAIMARVYEHKIVEELAKYSSVPVINGLSDFSHPTQILGDLLTIREKKMHLEGIRIAYVGDANNVANSLIFAAAKLGMCITLACPEGYEPNQKVLSMTKADFEMSKGSVKIVRAPEEAVQGADIIYTDVWTSMGQEAEREERRKRFQGYRVDMKLVKMAKPDVIVMHCLPAHYDEELSYEVAKSPNSVIYDQAENRMHAEKGILVNLIS